MKPDERDWRQTWEGTMQEVRDGLWITDIDAVEQQSTDHFDLVVSVCQDAARDNVGCPYEHYELADDEISVENWGGSADYDTFAEAAESVVNALRDDTIEKILIHCHAGQNRSCTVSAAALAVYNERPYYWAFNKIQVARPIVNPNQTMRSHAKRFILEHS
jgi:predicted protein tyrosine phosphatase